MADITIEDSVLNRIKSVIGYPRINKVVYTDPEIKEYVIRGVLREYFNKWPIIYRNQTALGSTSVTLDFPDSYTYGVVNASVVGKGGQGGSESSFWDVVKWQYFTGYTSSGLYGKRQFNPNGLRDTYFDINRQLNTLSNQLTTQDMRIDRNARTLTVYSGVTGYLLVHWAKYSDDFADVRQEWHEDVVHLCQAKLQILTGKTVGLVEDGELSVKFNAEAMKSEGQAEWDKIMEKWATIPAPIILYRVT